MAVVLVGESRPKGGRFLGWSVTVAFSGAKSALLRGFWSVVTHSMSSRALFVYFFSLLIIGSS